MFNIHLNSQQRKEFSKALFNFGNIIAGAVIVNQAVLGDLKFSAFIFGSFCVVVVFASAILLLEAERN
jgi:hypothetical protein